MRTLVLDLDDSLPGQPPLAARMAAHRAEYHPLRRLGPALRLWSLAGPFRSFQAYWRGLPRTAAPVLALLGSGDFHHLSACFIESAAGPLSVVHFDNHPDWAWTFPRRHCGSWVNEVLAMPHVQRVVTIGPCSDDIIRPRRRAGPWLHKLEIHPWWNSGARGSDGVVRARNLADCDWHVFLAELIASLPTERLWITIDKDVLAPDEAVTNWDQGGLPLARLVETIRRLARHFTIVGADICGEYAPINHRNPFKSLEARLDQPRLPPQADLAVNARTNETLISTFEEIW
ncbi:arginase family protein [Zavarzinia compransoris]|uniref:Arginase n=1 Tax=Zavarzinia compransoris TaxID=1264899 RepID=A0A317E907_9PROT|nr:arginase family protein [Zavarzinia compransoris]PWR23062.1 arginase [Zavarzinia compransoris]TDP46393.1 arginase family protein [Zavarzinia compransoris]